MAGSRLLAEVVEVIPQLGVSGRPLRWGGAVALCVALASITALGFHARGVSGVEIHAFLPVCATLWASAELLTAFLLLSQFYVAGKLSYALLAAAYGSMGLLTIPYIVAFPGLFPIAESAAAHQISIWLWAIWHVGFPLAIAAIYLFDPSLESRTVPRAAISKTLRAVVCAVAFATATVAIAVTALAERLPVLIDAARHFTPWYTTYAAPAIVLCNGAACAFVFSRSRNPTSLQLWIGVALFASTLDGLLNAFSTERFSPLWYVGKCVALAAASVVLLMLLYEVSDLYRRLYDAASIDALTGLANRRALDINLEASLGDRRAKTSGSALLLLDLDNFKQYNDRYGHVAGDEALRAIGRILRASVLRQGDVVARYGGEEFAVLLRDTEMSGAREVAERIRQTVEGSVLRIGSEATSVTTSIGIAYVAESSTFSVERILSAADRALYKAKAQGRNCIRLHDLRERPLRYAHGASS